MIDIQNSKDTREIPLQKVGIKDLKYPVRVLDKVNKFQQTTANVNLFVNLPHNYKGTHMSRFIEIFHRNRNELGMKNFLAMLEEIRQSLDAEKAYGSMTFPFFMTKCAPVSSSESIMNYVCTYEGEVQKISANTESAPLTSEVGGEAEDFSCTSEVCGEAEDFSCTSEVCGETEDFSCTSEVGGEAEDFSCTSEVCGEAEDFSADSEVCGQTEKFSADSKIFGQTENSLLFSKISCETKNPLSAKSEIKQKFFVKIQIPITTLCPCSKAISKYGAHNQRGIVSVKLQNKSFFWIEDVIELVENCASSGLYSILKRPDEKFVTEHAYENPRFVEDIVREVYMALKNFNKSEKPFTSFSVECENFESIHNHNAYAYAEYNPEKK